MQKFDLKFIDYRLFFTIICVIFSKLPIGLPIQSIAVFGVLTVGILHGANDLSLIKRLGFLKSKAQRFLIYVCFVLFFSTLLYRIPVFSLMIFVAISSYHFGEQQWYKRLEKPSLLISMFYVVYGLFLFSILFLVHTSNVCDIIYQISGFLIPPTYFKIFALVSSVSLGIITLLSMKSFKGIFLDFIFETFVLILMFLFTDLLLGFAIYFVFWHSWPSLKDQVIVLYGTKGSVQKYFADAWLYWVLSIVGLGLLYSYNDAMGLDPLALFFAFLAAITFPHVLVIFGLNRLFKPNANA